MNKVIKVVSHIVAMGALLTLGYLGFRIITSLNKIHDHIEKEYAKQISSCKELSITYGEIVAPNVGFYKGVRMKVISATNTSLQAEVVGTSEMPITFYCYQVERAQ